jgi:hypothetical protein
VALSVLTRSPSPWSVVRCWTPCSSSASAAEHATR